MLLQDDLRIETRWSDFKRFNVKVLEFKVIYMCAFVGVLIK